MNELTLYQVMMYSCEESELGGVRNVSITEGGRELVAEKLAARKAARAAEPGKPTGERQPAGNGTPLGRAFRKFLG